MLIKGLKSCINLKRLDLSIFSIDISCNGAVAIAYLLQSSRNLRELDLSHDSKGTAIYNNQVLNVHYGNTCYHKYNGHFSLSVLRSCIDYETTYLS